MNTLAPPLSVPAATSSKRSATPALALLALGIVYGDIGTSPLYAVKETFNPSYGIPLTPASILGGLSAIFWALMIVVTLKYVTLVLRADNRGEGGIMALLAVATTRLTGRTRWALTLLGLAGAALFYGDAVLTPAISVLSAVEGLEVGTDLFKPWVVPLSAGILVGLFLIQRQGTGLVGAIFGPVCLVWFAALAASGAWNIARAPQVLEAMHPLHAWRFLTSHGTASFLVLGSVLLAITGAEALYADMGHFGKRAIRVAWFAVVAPALVLNYFGQGALLLADPAALDNPFYRGFPAWALYPMVVLATAATVIASQATISGAYSATQQAIQLGYLPRMAIRHTSDRTVGQIYVPVVNWILLVAVIAAVAGFGSSTRLASAYGVAVMGTMLVTTVLSFFVLRDRWHYPLVVAAAATAFFLAVDTTLFAAAAHKLFEGGWFPLALGSAVLAVMLTWRGGRRRLQDAMGRTALPLRGFLAMLLADPPQRVPGTAVFLNADREATPNALLHSLKHYKVLHETNVFMSVAFADTPAIDDAHRLSCVALGHACWQVTVAYGFRETPDVPLALEMCGPFGLRIEPMEVSYFLSREKVVPVATTGRLAAWRDRLFAAMARNAGSVTDYFGIPTNRVVEIGTRVEI
jgi:KUP system potassium uptake protein